MIYAYLGSSTICCETMNSDGSKLQCVKCKVEFETWNMYEIHHTRHAVTNSMCWLPQVCVARLLEPVKLLEEMQHKIKEEIDVVEISTAKSISDTQSSVDKEHQSLPSEETSEPIEKRDEPQEKSATEFVVPGTLRLKPLNDLLDSNSLCNGLPPVTSVTTHALASDTVCRTNIRCPPFKLVSSVPDVQVSNVTLTPCEAGQLGPSTKQQNPQNIPPYYILPSTVTTLSHSGPSQLNSRPPTLWSTVPRNLQPRAAAVSNRAVRTVVYRNPKPVQSPKINYVHSSKRSLEQDPAVHPCKVFRVLPDAARDAGSQPTVVRYAPAIILNVMPQTAAAPQQNHSGLQTLTSTNPATTTQMPNPAVCYRFIDSSRQTEAGAVTLTTPSSSSTLRCSATQTSSISVHGKSESPLNLATRDIAPFTAIPVNGDSGATNSSPAGQPAASVKVSTQSEASEQSSSSYVNSLTETGQKKSSTSRDSGLAIPIVDVSSAQTVARLKSLGISHYVPLSAESLKSEGVFAIPLIVPSGNNDESSNIGSVGYISLGHAKKLL